MFTLNDKYNIYNNIIELTVLKRKQLRNINWNDIKKKINCGDCSVIGKGSYGTVYNVLINEYNIAIKVSDLSNLSNVKKDDYFYKNKKDDINPIDFGCCLSEGLRVMLPKSSRLTECYGFYIDDKKWKIYTAMEFCKEGDLVNFIKSYTTLYEKKVKRFFYQMLEGVSQLNENKIMHRDLKPSNIFITSTCDLKLGDFGLSGYIKTNNILRYDIITRWYRPPELELDFEYNENIDVFSIGCIIMEILTKKPLIQSNEFDHFEQVIRVTGKMSPECISYYDKIIEYDEQTFLFNHYKLNNYYNNRKRKWNLIKKFNDKHNKKSILDTLFDNLKCTSELKEVILLTLDKNLNTRPSAYKLLQHSYFSKNNKNKKLNIENNINLLQINQITINSTKSDKINDTINVSDFIWNTVSYFNYSNATFILSFNLFTKYIKVTKVENNKLFSTAVVLIFIVATYITEYDTKSISLDKYLCIPNATMSNNEFKKLLSCMTIIIIENNIIPHWNNAFEINSLLKKSYILLIYCILEYNFENLTVTTTISFVKKFLVLLEKYPSNFYIFNKICNTKSNNICSLCYDYFKENYSIFLSFIFSNKNIKFIFESDVIIELILSYL